jgi:ABC-2 type transport system permease protein
LIEIFLFLYGILLVVINQEMKKTTDFSNYALGEEVKYYLDFLFLMTKKEIKARYKRAKIGFLWAFINPLLQMLVMGFVFQFFVPVEVDNYFLFIFIALLPWNFFSETVSKATNVFVDQRALIAKAKFPKEILLLSVVLANLFNTVIAFLLLLLFILFFQANLFSNFSYLGIFAVFAYLLFFTTGFSFLTATLNVKNRDTAFVVKFLLMLWFYLTPIVYLLDFIPAKLRLFFQLNPLTGIVEVFRSLFLGFQLTDFKLFLIVFVLSSIFSYLSFLFFKSREKYFDDYL